MSDREISEYLDEVTQRERLATAGEWVVHDLGDDIYTSENDKGWWWVWRKDALPYFGGVLEPGDRGERNEGEIGSAMITDGRDGTQERYDAEFIANAKQDVPKLVNALRGVLSHHVADGNGCCVSCWDFNEDTDVKYPCPTVVDIEKALGRDA